MSIKSLFLVVVLAVALSTIFGPQVKAQFQYMMSNMELNALDSKLTKRISELDARIKILEAR